MARQTKPRPSRIEALPLPVQELVNRLLREGATTQREILAIVNKELDKLGQDPLSRSGLNRYAVRMEQVGQRLRQARGVARLWIDRLGQEPEGDVGRLLNEIVRTMAFDFATKAAEGEEPIDPQMLRALAVTVERLEQAARTSAERERVIRKDLAEQAAGKVQETARKAGLSDETIEQIQRDILGLAS
ncbi:MAG: DUF3486 family protein [Magnetococcales bacterium]|nr:DUF3486 family protein [Magnetococcales bacterium]